MRTVLSMCEMYPLIREVTESGGEFKLVTAGTSMLPMLRDRMDTAVLVKPTFPLKKYDVILYKRKDNSFVLHRIVKVRKNDYVLCGDAQYSFEYGVVDSDVVALLSAYIKDGKRIECSSFKNVIYKCFWCKTRGIRYFFLRVKKLLRKLFKR